VKGRKTSHLETPCPKPSNRGQKRQPRKYLALFVHNGPSKDTLRKLDALDQSGGTVPTNSNRLPGKLVVGVRNIESLLLLRRSKEFSELPGSSRTHNHILKGVNPMVVVKELVGKHGILNAKRVMKHGKPTYCVQVEVEKPLTEGDWYCFGAYGRFRVEAPWRFPAKCGKCQKYGHYTAKCTVSDLICAKCSKAGHKAKECPNPMCPEPTTKGISAGQKMNVLITKHANVGRMHVYYCMQSCTYISYAQL